MLHAFPIVAFAAAIASWVLAASLAGCYFQQEGAQPPTAPQPAILVAAARAPPQQQSQQRQSPPPLVEGYWPDPDVCLKLGRARPPWWKRRPNNAACPQWQIVTDTDGSTNSWTEREEFITKLSQMEQLAQDCDRKWRENDDDECNNDDDNNNSNTKFAPKIAIRRERGMASSRIEPDVLLGNSEYVAQAVVAPEVINGKNGEQRNARTTTAATVRWTDALLPHYVQEHGVRPSKQFRDFVHRFDLEAFRRQVDALKGGGGGESCRSSP